MKIKALAIVSLLTLLLNPVATMAQKGVNSVRDWEAVKAVSVREKLSIRLKDGKNLEGKLSSVTDTTLTLEREKKSVDLNRDSIAKVYRLVKRSTGKSIARSAGIGAGIGFGTGAGVGIWGGTYEDLETTALVLALGGIGAGIGGGIGAIVGAFGSKQRRVLVYEWK